MTNWRRRMRAREREANQRRVVAAANSYVCGCGHSMSWHKKQISQVTINYEGRCEFPGCECSGLDFREGRLA